MEFGPSAEVIQMSSDTSAKCLNSFKWRHCKISLINLISPGFGFELQSATLHISNTGFLLNKSCLLLVVDRLCMVL